jgi:hypothetical protein
VGRNDREMDMLANGMDRLQQLAKVAGPYLLLEIFMPGGTLLALLLYSWKRFISTRNPASGRCG